MIGVLCLLGSTRGLILKPPSGSFAAQPSKCMSDRAGSHYSTSPHLDYSTVSRAYEENRKLIRRTYETSVVISTQNRFSLGKQHNQEPGSDCVLTSNLMLGRKKEGFTSAHPLPPCSSDLLHHQLTTRTMSCCGCSGGRGSSCGAYGRCSV